MARLTLAALKRRLVPGTKLTLVMRYGIKLNTPRIVASQNTVGVRFTDTSELPWPKADRVREWVGGFLILDPETGTEALRYRWDPLKVVGADGTTTTPVVDDEEIVDFDAMG